MADRLIDECGGADAMDAAWVECEGRVKGACEHCFQQVTAAFGRYMLSIAQEADGQIFASSEPHWEGNRGDGVSLKPRLCREPHWLVK